MTRLVLSSILIVVAALVLRDVSAAHGGTYRGPGSTVPPGGQPPPVAAPPSTPAGATTPGARPAGLVPLVAVQPRPVHQPQGRRPRGRQQHRGRGLLPGSGPEGGPHQPLRPAEAQLRGQVVPALLEALHADPGVDLRTAILIALGKIGDDPSSRTSTSLAAHIRPFLSDSNQEVAETAAIALGILASERSVFLLADLLGDTPAGRKAVGEREVPYRTRAFAAYGLGLVGNRSSREDVRRFIVSRLAKACDDDTSATPT